MANIELRIICIGNLLHGNDGVGHAVFSRLQSLELPPNIELLEGGIGGMTLLPFFRGCRRVLLIDLMKSEAQEGQIAFFSNVVSELPFKVNQAGAHGGDLTTLLAMLPIYLETLPQVDLLCVSATEIRHYEPRLDSRIEQVIGEVCRKTQDYIGRCPEMITSS